MQENVSMEIVHAIVDYIEENVHNKFRLEDIANSANISMYHLHRIFRALTRKKLMRYVTSRKLASSIHELLHTNLRIIDIASEYHFDYEQSYIRAFIREFGVSPDEFRKKGCPLTITDKVDLNHIRAIGSDGMLFEPRILIRPGFYLAGIRQLVNNRENYKTFELTDLANDFFYRHLGRIRDVKNPCVYLGLIEHIPDNEVLRYYTASVEVSDLSNLQGDLYGRFIPSHKYAVFKYIGMHHPNRTTIKDLFSMHAFAGRWISQSNYVVSDMFRFERVDSEVGREDYCEVEIFIPVADKGRKAKDDYSWILKLTPQDGQ